MKRAAIISHGLAVAVGLLMAATVLPRPGARGNTDALTRPELSAKSAAREESAKARGAREMLEELSHMPMEPSQRRSLKEELWREWAKADPEGLLRHLQDRAWPSAGSFMSYGAEHAFDEMARRNPEALIDYARREGCGAAWSSLCGDGDPRRILPLLLAKTGQEPVPAWIFRTLFARGLEVDSSFQNEFSRLKAPAERDAAFFAISEELLDLRRFDDYFRFTGESGMEASAIGKEFGKYAGKDTEVIGEIEDLPEAARPLAVAGVIGGLHEYSRPEDTMRVLGILNDAGWWGWTASEPGWREKLQDLTSDISWGPEDSDSWCDWALKLAEDGEVARFLKETSLRMWSRNPGPDWQPRLAAITDPALHDMAAATLALGLPGEEEASAVVGMIADGELREKTAEELQSRKERGDDGDPFGRE